MAEITSPIMLDSTGQEIVTALNRIGSKTASDVTYDGTTSGLSADDVQEAIDELASEKQDTLTFDASPTESSTNPVTSGGVYEDTQNVYGVMGVNGAKNLWKIANKTGSGTGLTFTPNSDGSVTMSAGTATSECKYPVEENNLLYSGEDLKPSTNYIVSIGTANAGVSIQAYYKETQSSSYTALFGVSGVSEYSFTTPSTFYSMWIRIRVSQDTTVSEATFYPMIRLAADTDSTYQPYAQTNYQLTTNKADITALGTNESGTTASQAYSVGEHFYKDGYFCTVTSAIASGDTLTEGTNYSVGDVADILKTESITVTDNHNIELAKSGNVVTLSFESSSNYDVSANTTFYTLPQGYKPLIRIGFSDTYSNKRIIIDTSGKVYSTEAISNTYLRGAVTYIASNL